MLPDLNPVLTAFAALLFSVGGWAAIARAMARHHPQFSSGALTAPRALAARTAGLVLLGAALAACIAGWGVTVGIVGWTCAISVAAVALIFALPAWPPAARVAAYGAPLAGALMCLAAAF